MAVEKRDQAQYVGTAAELTALDPYLQAGESAWAEDTHTLRVGPGQMSAVPLLGEVGVPPGLTGATAATRYVGGTTTGAPVSGTFAKGDVVVAQDGILWVCTAAGTPGTWVDGSSSGRELAYAESSTVQSGITTVVDLTGIDTGDFTVGLRPVYVTLFLPLAYPVTNANIAVVTITDTSNNVTATGYGGLTSTTLTGVPITVTERISTPGTYRRKGRIARSGAGSITNNLDATTKTFIRVVTA